ncbi:MAG: hypothetical protein COZ05_16705 [Armatimonadetes bacterium CG_4_10_14_3_um_filter_59_10]|nr:MAG: hypothetical protein COZ05_16705 [Armatimonadetes bacterium CG_4_10_14_3_um_filter_59_10]
MVDAPNNGQAVGRKSDGGVLAREVRLDNELGQLVFITRQLLVVHQRPQCNRIGACGDGPREATVLALLRWVDDAERCLPGRLNRSGAEGALGQCIDLESVERSPC